MIELKARLYDIGERLEELKNQRTELCKDIKEKALSLHADIFLPVLSGKAEELRVSVEKLIKNIEETQSLTKEAQDIKNKLEVMQK